MSFRKCGAFRLVLVLNICLEVLPHRYPALNYENGKVSVRQPWFKEFHPYQHDVRKQTTNLRTALRPNRSRDKQWSYQQFSDFSNNQFSDVSSNNPIVHTNDGALRGFTMRTVSGRMVSAFQSIPFSEPPIGPLRFQAPRKNRPWNGTRDAIAESPQCVQMDFIQQMQVHGQEDCLYLNVYVPQRSWNYQRKLPVMVYIHGGAFFYGAGSLFGPAYLLDSEDVILITVNYRLGAIGFMSTGDNAASGNAGLKDLVLALKWVQSNVQFFNGNPDSVTLFGQSSGAGAIQLLMLSPLARGLFHRGISESGSTMCYWSILENSVATARQLAQNLNCTTSSHRRMVQCLQNVPAEALAGQQLAFAEWSLFPLMVFGPVVEHAHPGAFISEKPEDAYRKGRAAKVPWITGFNSHELSWLVSAMIQDPNTVTDINNDWDRISPIMLALDGNRTRRVWDFYMGDQAFNFNSRHNFSNIIGDRYFLECGLEAMRYHSRFTGMPVYGYYFNYQGRYSAVQQVGADPQDWGVAHTDEIIYLLNNTVYYETLEQGDPEFRMSRLMTNIWANFATYGKPFVNMLTSENVLGNGWGQRIQDIWQPIQPSNNKFSPLRFLELNLQPKMIGDPYVDRYNFWRRINPNP